jgi:single-strand DNA-binding protein
MASFNKIILIGNLTRDPQLSYLPSQTPVCEFGLAVNEKWKDREGQPQERTCFIDCTAFGKQAETINQHLTKGRAVLVEGSLQFDQWEDRDGKKRSKHRVRVIGFQFMDGGKGKGEQDEAASAEPAAEDSIPF